MELADSKNVFGVVLALLILEILNGLGGAKAVCGKIQVGILQFGS